MHEQNNLHKQTQKSGKEGKRQGYFVHNCARAFKTYLTKLMMKVIKFKILISAILNKFFIKIMKSKEFDYQTFEINTLYM